MPEQNANFDEIQRHRQRIDAIDRQLVSLLNERAGESLAIRGLKPGAGMDLFDPKREEEIYQRIDGCSEGTLCTDGLNEIYAVLLKVMKENPGPAAQ